MVAAVSICLLQASPVIAQDSSASRPSLSLQDVSHFDASKYALPLPSNGAAVSAEGNNQTASLAAIASAMAEAAAESPSQDSKYILPVPSQVPKAEGAAAESPASAPTAALSKGSSARTEAVAGSAAETEAVTGTSAQIEAVSGFVQRQGQNFVLNGKTVYFAGTNAW